MIKDLFRDGYRSIFIGTGVLRPKTLGIKGESFGIDALDIGDIVFYLSELIIA